MEQILARLDHQDRMLEAILAGLQPPEQSEGSGLEELVQALQDLRSAVEQQGLDIRVMRLAVSEGFLPGAEAA